MKVLLSVTLICFASGIFAQNANAVIKEGNEKYKQQDYSGAQQSYEQATVNDPNSNAGTFNLGNAYYQQKQYDKAIEQFQKAGETAQNPTERADAYHNLGNSYLQQKKYQESVNAYKQSLRNSPEDVDTKYNLAYAQKMLKEQKQRQDQQQKDKDQQKQDQQKKDQQQKQDQQKKDQDQQQKEQQSQPKQYSKEELERILESLNNDDKSVQNKINKQKTQKSAASGEKDW